MLNKNFVSVVRPFLRARFNDSERILLDFITRRHYAFGARSVLIADDNGAFDPSLLAADGVNYVIHVNAMNPFTDFDAVESMVERLVERNAATATVEGAVPGTEPDRVIRLQAANLEQSVRVYVDAQRLYNNQINVYKYKRLKLFRALVERVPELHQLRLPELIEVFRHHHDTLALYASGAEPIMVEACPHCDSRHLKPLHGVGSQPLIGFVTPDRPLYKQCEDCGLAIMTPHAHPAQTALLYDEYDFSDHVASREGPGQALPLCERMEIALSMIESSLPSDSAVLDLGGGSGQFSYHVKTRHPSWRVVHADFSDRHLPYLHDVGVETHAINLANANLGESAFDLITSFDVVEHFDYANFVDLCQRVHKALRPGGHFLFTTPDMDSPLTQAFDFFNNAAPFHLLVFGERWLNGFFADPRHGFTVEKTRWTSELLEDHDGFLRYYAETGATMQTRAAARLLHLLLANKANRDLLLEKSYGTQIAMLLRRTA